MGVLADIFEIVNDLRKDKYFSDPNSNGEIPLKNLVGRKSIASLSKNAIMQFPVLVSDSIPLEQLTMINKALERQYATFIRIAMGLDDIIDSDEIKNKKEYLQKFHQNFSNKTSIHDFKKLGEDNINLCKPYESDLRLTTLNEMTNKNNVNHYILGSGKKQNIILEAPGDDVLTIPVSDRMKFENDKQLVDNDVKKSNELIPTTITNKIYFHNNDGTLCYTEVLYGVKCISHAIPSEELLYNLIKAVEEKRSLFKFIQWTTGEIAFFKDFLFTTDALKREAIGTNRDSNWWRSLRNRARMSRLRRFTFSKKEILPNTTIVISMDEIEYLINSSGIDLYNNKKAVQILLETFFLLGFVIVDGGAEIAHFFFDGEETFQSFSFSALEKENKNSANEIKSMISLMNKMR